MTIIDIASVEIEAADFSILSVWPLAQLQRMSAMTARRIEADREKLGAEMSRPRSGQALWLVEAFELRIARQQAIKAAIDREISGRE